MYGGQQKRQLKMWIHIGDVKLKQMQEFNLDCVITDNGICDSPNVHRNSEKCLSGIKQSIKTYKNIVKNEEKSTKLLSDI